MQDWTLGYDQFIQEMIEGKMNKWGDSTVATKYIWSRLEHIMSNCFDEEMEQELFILMDELAHNYKIDTGNQIKEIK